MSAFAFIPRKVAKRVTDDNSKGISKVSANSHTQNFAATTESAPLITMSSEAKGKAKEGKEISVPDAALGKRNTDEDYVVLVSMALSDHALWANPDLRRKIDRGGSEEGESVMVNEYCTSSGFCCTNRNKKLKNAAKLFLSVIFCAVHLSSKRPVSVIRN
jgi:hypothetical protein